MSGGSIKDTDKGYEAFRAACKREVTISVGIFEAEGSAPKHEDTHSAQTFELTHVNGELRNVKKRIKLAVESSSVTLAQVAEWNEFGTSRIPARPFIRGFVDDRREDIMTWIKRATERVAKGVAPEEAFEIVGLRIQSGMQKRIADGVPPPNAASTIARKGSSKPLINTGQLRSSITYKVVVK